MCTQEQLLIIVKKIVSAYKEVFGSDIKSILLYGSYARGDYDNQSDIDFVAIVSGDRLDLQNKLEKVWDKAAEIGVENDAVISPAVQVIKEYLQRTGCLV